MAFQAVPDTVEIDMIFTQNSIPAQNVFYAKLPGGYSMGDLVAMAAAIDANWTALWRLRQPADVVYLRTEVRGLAVENDIIATDNTSSAAGTHAGSALPNNVTLSIKKESGLTGRSARGRTYWIGIPATELVPADENLIDTVYVANIVSSVDSVRGTINGVGLWEAVLVSRFQGGLKRVVGVTFPWVSTINVDNRVDTQRGRLHA